MQPEFHFKLRLVKKPKGLFEQLPAHPQYVPYDRSKFSLDELKKAFSEMYQKRPQTQRKVTLRTNQAGYELFQKALEQEFKKQKYDRKRLSIKSKVFK